MCNNEDCNCQNCTCDPCECSKENPCDSPCREDMGYRLVRALQSETE